MSLYSVDNIKEKLVISLYAKGMSVSDIEEEMREIYEIELSTSAISIITNKVNQAAQEWQNRPLDPVYLIVWMILPILTFQPINCFGNFVHQLLIGSSKCVKFFDYICFIIV